MALAIGSAERKALNAAIQAAIVAAVDAATPSVAGIIEEVAVEKGRLFFRSGGSTFNCFLSDPQASTVAKLTFRKRGPVKVNNRAKGAKVAETAKAE